LISHREIKGAVLPDFFHHLPRLKIELRQRKICWLNSTIGRFSTKRRADIWGLSIPDTLDCSCESFKARSTFRRRSWTQRFGLLRARALLRRMQSDRVLLVLPLVVFILFLAAMAALVSYSQQADLQRDKDNLQRDSEWAQQRISLDLTLAQDQVQAIANNLSLHEDRPGPFDVQALRLLRRYPQLFLVYYAHPDGAVVFKKGNPNLATEQIATLVGKTLKRANSLQLMQQALVSQRTAYSTPFKSADNGWLLETATPVVRNDQLAGVVGVVYSVDGILRNSVPEDLNASYAVSLLGPDNQLLDSASSQPIRDKALQYRAPLAPFRARSGAAGQQLSQQPELDDQGPVLERVPAVGAHPVDAIDELEPAAPTPERTRGAHPRNRLSPRHRKLAVHRHAGGGHAGTHSICQPVVLPHDRL
jgi:hypothetical protein